MADGKGDYGFCYINMRIAARAAAMRRRRQPATRCWQRCKAHFASVFEKQHVGMTLQIDESPGQVYDAKHSNLHPLFNK